MIFTKTGILRFCPRQTTAVLHTNVQVFDQLWHYRLLKNRSAARISYLHWRNSWGCEQNWDRHEACLYLTGTWKTDTSKNPIIQMKRPRATGRYITVEVNTAPRYAQDKWRHTASPPTWNHPVSVHSLPYKCTINRNRGLMSVAELSKAVCIRSYSKVTDWSRELPTRY